MWIARRFEEDLLVGYKVKGIEGFVLFSRPSSDFVRNGTKLGKPDTPSSKNDCQSECAGIYFKSIYLMNGTAFPGTRYSLLFLRL